MIYLVVPFPMTLNGQLTYISRSRGYYWCPRHIVCAADARSVKKFFIDIDIDIDNVHYN